MKLTKSIKVRGVIIPAGTELEFSNEGYADIAGLKIAKTAIPEAAFEHQSQRRSQGSAATLKKSIRLGADTIPAGTTLMFSNEGYAEFEGKQISIYQIPSVAFESYEGINNKVDPEQTWKPFDKVEPGDMGVNSAGEHVRFLGKAVGKAGYDALLNQFGDSTGKTFEELTAGMSEDEIKEAQFVAISSKDDSVAISLYGADYAAATEATTAQVLDIEEVEPGDAAIDYEGKPCVIIAKGQGLTWYKKMLQAIKCEDCLKEIKEALGVDEDDKLDKTWFVLTTNDDNAKMLSHYGESGVKVFKSDAE